MTNEEHQQWREAMERYHNRMMADKEASKKLLIELGIWHLLVPLKSTKKTTKPSRPSSRKK